MTNKLALVGVFAASLLLGACASAIAPKPLSACEDVRDPCRDGLDVRADAERTRQRLLDDTLRRSASALPSQQRR